MTSDFYTLLNSIVNEQKFLLTLSPSDNTEFQTIECKHITTSQLKSLIETVIDNPITQVSFNTVTTKIFKECLLQIPPFKLNIVDKLLFILQTRIQSISPLLTVIDEDSTFEVDLNSLYTNVLEKLKTDAALFRATKFTENKISITVGIPLLETEQQLNDELYSKMDLTLDDQEELKKTLSVTFINEIAKSVFAIEVDGNAFDLSSVSFKERLNMIESLPASLMQKAIEYTEKYKAAIDSCLSVSDKRIIIDGKLFSNQ